MKLEQTQELERVGCSTIDHKVPRDEPCSAFFGDGLVRYVQEHLLHKSNLSLNRVRMVSRVDKT
jgi:hypothetical protein